MKIYTAGPISGMSYEEAIDYFTSAKKQLTDMGYQVLSPFTGKDYLRNEIELRADGYNNPISTNHAIFRRDRWMVGQADVILCNLSRAPEKVSIGSMFELAWASDLHKHVVVVLPKENTHNHAFVLEAADIIFETYEEAMNYLEMLIAGKY